MSSIKEFYGEIVGSERKKQFQKQRSNAFPSPACKPSTSHSGTSFESQNQAGQPTISAADCANFLFEDRSKELPKPNTKAAQTPKFEPNTKAAWTPKVEPNTKAAWTPKVEPSHFAGQPPKLIQISQRQLGGPLLSRISFTYEIVPHLSADIQIGQLKLFFAESEFLQHHPLYLRSVFGTSKLFSGQSNEPVYLLLHENSDQNSWDPGLDFFGSLNADVNIQMTCVEFGVSLLLAWSLEECSQIVSALAKHVQNDSKGAFNSLGKKPYSALQSNSKQALEILESIRTITQRDTRELAKRYESLSKVILVDDYRDFLKIEGFAHKKMQALTACFKGAF